MNCMDLASLFEIFFSVPNPIQAFMRQNMYPNRVSSEAQEGTSHRNDEETYFGVTLPSFEIIGFGENTGQ